MAFYENFERLCTEKGITPTQVAKDNGIRQSVVAMWKNRGSTPRYNTAKKIAEYFGVSVDYLISGNQETFQLHLACGVHIYKNIVPFENVEELLSCFEYFKDKCTVIDPFDELPYSRLAGNFIDKFGVQWGFMTAN